jgi:hypothetical protein
LLREPARIANPALGLIVLAIEAPAKAFARASLPPLIAPRQAAAQRRLGPLSDEA